MKIGIFRKAVSAAVSGALLLSAVFAAAPALITTDAASNKSRVSVHDPSIIKNGDTYYVFGSHIDAAKSNDLQNWNRKDKFELHC